MWLFYSMSNSVSLRQMLVQLSLGQMRRKIVAAAASADISPITSIAVAIGPVVPYICNFQSISLISIVYGTFVRYHIRARVTNWLHVAGS